MVCWGPHRLELSFHFSCRKDAAWDYNLCLGLLKSCFRADSRFFCTRMLSLPKAGIPLQRNVLFLCQHNEFFFKWGFLVTVGLIVRIFLRMRNVIHVTHLTKNIWLCSVLF